MKEKNDFEIFCYENEDGEICLEFGEAAIRFPKKRFVEFADKLNQVRQSVMREILLQTSTEKTQNSTYRI